MVLSRGSRLGPYEVVNPLGEGGMGEVYRARDTRLDRSVAIKIFKQDFSERFEREARAISSLNHPNICTLHDIGREGDTPYLVMELVDGEPLRGPMPVAQAINSALQVLDALQLAHRAGIVHRDLKPANILQTKSGVKLLDFGLAKKIAPGSEAGAATLTMDLSGDSGLEGTLQYMSPEQMEGHEADVRSDIFSFGCVFYEMLTGSKVFTGDSPASVIAAVLSNEPRPIGDLIERAGRPLELMIRRCLEKRPEDRWQSVSDLRSALKIFALQSGIQTRKDRPERRIPRLVLGLLVLAPAVALAGGWYLGFRWRSKTTPDLRVHALAGADDLALAPAWSSDGRFIAYARMNNGALDIFSRELSRGTEIQITSGTANESDPAFSPDGRVIALSSDEGGGGVFLAPSGGGVPARLTTFGARPVWSPDGTRIAFDWSGCIYVIGQGGGQPRKVAGGTGDLKPYPVWSPDGRHLLFWHRVRNDIVALELETATLQPLGLIQTGEEVKGLTLSRDGKTMVFSRGPIGGNRELWQVQIDPDRLQPVSAPVRLTLALTDNTDPQLSPDGKRLSFCVREVRRHLWSYPLPGDGSPRAGQGRRITVNGERNYYPVVSPDEKTLVWTSQSGDNGLLYFRRLGAAEDLKLTQDWESGAREVLASFSPDSQQLVYASTAGGAFQIWRMPSLQSVSLKITECRAPERDTWPAWSRDGKQIAFHSSRGGSLDIWLVSPEGGARRRITDWPSNESRPQFSPDGRLLGFMTDRNGHTDIWSADMLTGKLAPLVELEGEDGPFEWTPDGKWLYYISSRGGGFDLWRQPSSGGPAELVIEGGIQLAPPEDLSVSKFALTRDQIIIPMETQRSRIYLMEQLP